MHILKRIFPFLSWFKGYDQATLRTDFLSGLTVALVLVPQSMAYAQLAGLPAYYGLYAALLPPLIASLFGSSRQLATGPVAVVSLMTSATLEPLATAGSEEFVAYALLLAFLVGLFQLALGLLRLGIIVNFLSHPVTNGFTNAAALIIATSQLSKIFGVYVDKASHHYETVIRVVQAAFQYSHWPTIGMAAISFATMIVLRRVNPRIPNVLVAVVLTTVLSWALGFEDNETVPVQNIQSPRTIELIESFNATVESKTALEIARATSQKTWAKLETNTQTACVKCHQARDPELFLSPPVEVGAHPPSGENAVVLHDMAGLVDRHIVDLKRKISVIRTELRGTVFEQTTSQADQASFEVRGERPDRVAAAGDPWRLKVDNKRLDLSSLTFSGGGAVVANIPAGLPSLRLPHFDQSVLPRLLFAAIIISLLGFMEAISIAKAMAARTKQKLDPNQELIGQGLANIFGCMAQSYPVSGSFSRSAVNLQAGAKTGLSNVFSSGVVMIVLLFFSKALYHLPQAVLASIIMMAVVGLLNVSGFVHAWRTSRVDGIVSVITFVGTLAFAPHLEWGIFIGVALSLGAYLYRSTRPHVVELAPHADGTMRNARRHELSTCRHLSVVGFEGPLYFASASYLETELLDRVAELPGLKQLLIAGNGITEVDASGEETLRHLVENLRGAGYAVAFSGMSENVLDVLRRSHLHKEIGEENFFGTRAQAIAATYGPAHEASDEEDCPFRKAMPPVIELSLHEDGSLRNVERHQLRVCCHVAALRFDAPLNFANTGFLEQEILERFADRPTLRHILFVSHGINDVDELGAQKLVELVKKLKADRFAVSFSGLKEEVIDTLMRNGLLEVMGTGDIYPTQLTAIASIYAAAHTGSSEKECPLRVVAPHLTELSWHHTGTLRDVEHHHLVTCESIGVLRMEGPLVLFSRKAIQSEFIRWAKTRPEVENVVLLANAIHKLGPSEQKNLVAFVEAVRDAGYRVVLASFTDQVFEALSRNGIVDEIGIDEFYPSISTAIAAVFHEAHAQTAEEECPLRGVLPRITRLALHPDGSFRGAHRHGLALCERIVAVRFDGPLDFSTIRYFEQELRVALGECATAKHILFAAHTLVRLDPIAAEELSSLVERLRDDGYTFVFSGLKDEELEVLRQTGRDDIFGVDVVFPTQAKAIHQVYDSAHVGTSEAACPLMRSYLLRKRPVLDRAEGTPDFQTVSLYVIAPEWVYPSPWAEM